MKRRLRRGPPKQTLLQISGSRICPIRWPAGVKMWTPSYPSPTQPALDQTRALMRSVVTEGSGTALQGAPGGDVFGKTGTAEYGTEVPPKTRAWFVGYQGDLAFAVLVEDGRSGGSVAAPIAKSFLDLYRAAPTAE